MEPYQISDIAASQHLEHFTESLSLEHLHDGRILVYTLLDASRSTLDETTDSIIRVMNNWSTDQPFLSAYDLSDFSFLSITPYARQKGRQMSLAVPRKLYGRTAVILHRNAIVGIFNLFIRHMSSGRFDYRLFHSREEAIAWLEEAL